MGLRDDGVKQVMSNFSLGQSLVALLLPTNCLRCGVEGEWVCDYCLANLSTQNNYRCVICSKASKDGLCDNHRRSTRLDGAVSLFPYKDPVIQKIIRRAKYAGQFDVLRFFAQKFSRQIIRRLPKDLEFVAVSIPLHQNRLKERGYNQAEILAESIGQKVCDLAPVLVRQKDTQPQAKLAKDKRIANIKGCFAVQGETPISVLLFDDVITTGATLCEAAKVLRKKGARDVWAITIAHG